MSKVIKSCFAFLLFVGCFGFSHAQQYHIIRYIHIGGKGGWDYITANNNRLYIAHDSLVNVLDEKSGDSVAVIAGVFGAHGIAFANGKGYATAGRLSSVIVFDQATNKVTGKIKTAAGPDAIMYEPFSKKIFVCDGHSQQATIIDPSSGKVTDSIALGGKPEEPVSDEAGNIYVNLEDKNEVVQINAKTFKIVNHWKTGTGESPGGLAIDNKNHLLFITCDDKVMVIMSAIDGKIVAQVTTGDGTDGAAFDASTGYAFSPNGKDGTLTLIHEDAPDKFTVVSNLPTKPGARTIALDAENHHIFLPTAEFGTVDPSHDKKRPPVLKGSFQLIEIGQ